MSVTFISSELDENARTCSDWLSCATAGWLEGFSGADPNQNKVMNTIAGGENNYGKQ